MPNKSTDHTKMKADVLGQHQNPQQGRGKVIGALLLGG